MGYPVILKPAVGSWGRLLAKVNDREAAEALLEHKKILGSYHHSVYYNPKICAQNRKDAIFAPLSWAMKISAPSIAPQSIGLPILLAAGRHRIARLPMSYARFPCAGAQAVGGGIVALDLFETDQGLIVNEVNYTMEFRNSISVTGVNIPGKVVDYVIQEAEKQG